MTQDRPMEFCEACMDPVGCRQNRRCIQKHGYSPLAAQHLCDDCGCEADCIQLGCSKVFHEKQAVWDMLLLDGNCSDQTLTGAAKLRRLLDDLIEARRDLKEMDTENDRLLNELGWIPVSERMPERFRPCIVAFQMHPGCAPTVCQETIAWDGQGWFVGVSTVRYSGHVTHWMPLPSAPKPSRSAFNKHGMAHTPRPE